MKDFHAEKIEQRVVNVAGEQVQLTSYAVGARFSCRISNLDPGADIARATGETRELAEKRALENAALVLEMRGARLAMAEATAKLGHRR